METRYLTATIRKSPTDGTGRFEAIAYDATAGDVDGIVVTPAGIASAVRTFERRGRPLVLRWQHQIDHPDTALGTITRVWQDGSRLMVAGQLDLSNPLSQRAYEAMLTGRLNELSIAWQEYATGTERRDGVAYMSDIELIEVSLVAAGANRGTRVTSVKSAPTEAANLRETILAAVAPTKAPNGADVAAELAAHETRVKAARAERDRRAAERAATESRREDIERAVNHAVPVLNRFGGIGDANDDERPERATTSNVGETVQGGPEIHRAFRPKPKREDTTTIPVYVGPKNADDVRSEA